MLDYVFLLTARGILHATHIMNSAYVYNPVNMCKYLPQLHEDFSSKL